MAHTTSHGSTATGTVAGTLLTVFANIHADDLVKTAVLAMIGATVSFLVSLALRWAKRLMR